MKFTIGTRVRCTDVDLAGRTGTITAGIPNYPDNPRYQVQMDHSGMRCAVYEGHLERVETPAPAFGKPKPGQWVTISSFVLPSDDSCVRVVYRPGSVSALVTPRGADYVEVDGRIGKVTAVGGTTEYDAALGVDGVVVPLAKCRLLSHEEAAEQRKKEDKATLRAKVLETFSADELRALADQK